MLNPNEIAAEALRKDLAAIDSGIRIKNGLTNESWLFKTTDSAVIVRLNNNDTRALQINRHSEAKALAAVADAGIGAPVHLCAPDRQILVTQYLPGNTWNARDARLPVNVKRIAGLLRQLHSMPVPTGVQNIDLMQVVCEYWNTLISRGLRARAGTPEMRERARQQITALDLNAQACLCHNDVHHLNIIDNGERLWLIDWEYAGVGDPFFDLASICVYHAFSEPLRRDLLAAYLGEERVATSAIERLRRMCWVFNYIRELWFGVRELS